MQILKGTIIIKFNQEELQTRRDAGASDAAIIHEALDELLAPFSPKSCERVSFHDCEITEEEALPF